jgi:hypothetical protein
MTTRIASLTSMILLALGLVAFTGSALAGNGNGNGNSKDTAATPTAPAIEITPQAAPGNSANAQGQGNGNGKDKGTVDQSAKGSAAQNSGTQAGVKPTNSTAKSTTCSTGGGQGSSATCAATGTGAANASSAGKKDSSKRYGNGKTAAQIANSRAAPAGTQVYGPGNSQPHKVWDCRRQHWVDVHAVKSYSTASCNTQVRQPTASETRTESCSAVTVTKTEVTAQKGRAYGLSKHGKATHTKTEITTTVTPTGNVCVTGTGATGATTSGGTTGGTNNSSHTSNTTAASNTQSAVVAVAGATGSAATPRGSSSPTGVLGVTASAGNSEQAGGVLGAVESVGSGVLPFTGFPLWIVVLAALALIVVGLALRRGRATV